MDKILATEFWDFEFPEWIMLNWPLFLLYHVVLNLVRQMYDSQTLFDTGRRNSEAVSRKRWFREISDWIWVHYITCLFFFLCGYIPETLRFCSFICLVFFADHWLCCVEVSADIEPLEYTPKPECPRGSGGALPSNTKGFIRFHGKDEIMCQFECLKHRIQQHRSITFTWSSSMDHATYAIMMKCFFRMDVSGLRQMQLMAVLGSLAKWWRQTIKTDQSILVSRTATDPVTSLERVCYLLNALWNAELFQHGDYGNIHPDPLAGTKECFRPTTKKMRHCGSR